MADRRAVPFAFAAPLGVAFCTVAATAAGSHIRPADMQKLRALDMPAVVAPVPPPAGFRVQSVVPNRYDRRYRIVYANATGGTITFEVEAVRGVASRPGRPGGTGSVPAGSSGYAEGASTPAPKRGFLQRLFSGKPSLHSTLAKNASGGTGSSHEAEGATSGSVVGSSMLLGPIRFAPAGACLSGSNDSTRASGVGQRLRVIVSACNFDDTDVLLSAYKRVQRVQ